MLFQPSYVPSTNPHRLTMNELFYAEEGHLIQDFLDQLDALQKSRPDIVTLAKKWTQDVRNADRSAMDMQNLLQAYPLSTSQGRSLMCLAEALLRIPDNYTADLLIQDKVMQGDWSELRKKGGFLERASSSGLTLLSSYFKKESVSKALSFATDPIVRKAFRTMMEVMGKEFILGETIAKALKRREKNEDDRYSYDMLGEAARTWEMAERYKTAYLNAIEAVGKSQAPKDLPMAARDSVSVKLSALHPQYNFAHYESVMERLVPDLRELALRAQSMGVALTVDAEEVDRLDLSLDVIERVFKDPSLKGWGGLGVVVQAYQKRAKGVIATLQSWAEETQTPIFVRLVKGAYWDTEIKLAQEKGLKNYPVYTRKASTDISYLACAEMLLRAEGCLIPQFATHNAYTVAAIVELMKKTPRHDVEFQRLQGMGEDLYKVVKADLSQPVRVYAPVGGHQDLLAYLVRRLLENGANSSFVNKIYDKSVSLDDVLSDPFVFFEHHKPGPHTLIPMPEDIYGHERRNSFGRDIDFSPDLEACARAMDPYVNQNHLAQPIVGKQLEAVQYQDCVNPSTGQIIGKVGLATAKDLDHALTLAQEHQHAWDLLGSIERGEILRKAADLLEERSGLFYALLIREAGKTLMDAQSEIREAVDFCRYYAYQAEKMMGHPKILPGPSGELNQLTYWARGTFACISPWNFPLAIFMGQVTAALATGNAVIAKPAMQTPLIGYEAVKVLHDAGVPSGILHFLPGKGSELGDPLVKDLRVDGVVFTGSTDTAMRIQKNLTDRGGPIVPLIAETGGLNAMIVDSSALLEQVVDDICVSAFQSAGQRCSALRLLVVQEEVAEPLVHMLKGAMADLNVRDSVLLSSDVGPVIDEGAQQDILEWITSHKTRVLYQTPCDQPQGVYVPPTLIALEQISDLTREIFGPVLHVCRFKAKELQKTVDQINELGFGLTMGIETRVDENIRLIRKSAKVGNLYVNRSMIGAVVGVQPFGGEGLSGTGPKAGGPHYLTRFVHERTYTENTMARGGNPDLLNLKE